MQEKSRQPALTALSIIAMIDYLLWRAAALACERCFMRTVRDIGLRRTGFFMELVDDALDELFLDEALEAECAELA